MDNIFGKAIWLTAKDATKKDILIMREEIYLENAKKAILRVLGLGFFHLYINGRRVDDAEFQPLNSEYEPRENEPVGEILSDFRAYVCEYDVKDFLRKGKNIIVIHFGVGWYCKSYKEPKAIWRLVGETLENVGFDFGSSPNTAKIRKSFITDYVLEQGETHDYCLLDESAYTLEFDDSKWENAVVASPLKTKYDFTDCPKDTVQAEISPVKIGACKNGIVYDCGVNTTGYPVLTLLEKRGKKVTVEFSEQLTKDGDLDYEFMHEQRMQFISDGKQRVVKPLFTWLGFRYFKVIGSARVEKVETVYANVKKVSGFLSDNEMLNWIHDTFMHTQLVNLHTGTPTDCPHLERRGYTGDGQLLCRAAMRLFDMRDFYKKWMQDIADGQDSISGHVQYTAPYVLSGGGPGGWGGAIVEVPYQYYLEYGDVSVLKKYYPNMLKYFSYLETHSTADLVTRDQDWLWCLGDWCTPTDVIIPSPFINTYFYVKYLNIAIEIASLIGEENDIPIFKDRIERKKQAIDVFYKARYDHDYLGGVQGANAFAIDIGLGTSLTYKNLVNRYEKLGEYDVGIFGTDVLTRVLFEKGDANLAVELLCGKGTHSFYKWKELGATTLWEYWHESLVCRSLNHPMFGAVVTYFYDWLLGIHCGAGGTNLLIAPTLVNQIGKLKGYRILPQGKVSIAYEKCGDTIVFEIQIPNGEVAMFEFAEEREVLKEGVNIFERKIK